MGVSLFDEIEQPGFLGLEMLLGWLLSGCPRVGVSVFHGIRLVSESGSLGLLIVQLGRPKSILIQNLRAKTIEAMWLYPRIGSQRIDIGKANMRCILVLRRRSEEVLRTVLSVEF